MPVPATLRHCPTEELFEFMNNIFSSLPETFEKELVDELVQSGSLRIERIVSRGHASPTDGWYDQEENEWVIVLEGAGKILFEDGDEVKLAKGDYLNIPSHRKHRVIWTAPESNTIWLAIFYR
jgi:cupin 2 domain-containing protein